MQLLFAIASDTFEGSGRTPVPLSRGLSLIAKYASDNGQKSLAGSTSQSQKASSLADEAAASAAPNDRSTQHADVVAEAAVRLVKDVDQDQLPGATGDSAPHITGEPASVASSVQVVVPCDGGAARLQHPPPSPDDVVGIRPPRNERRATLPSRAPTLSNTGCSDVYRHYCAAYEVKTNSRVLQILQQHEAHTQTPLSPFQDLTSLDVSLCMLRDRGLLPVVEVLRLCINLRSLNLSGNDLTNEGIEYLAHAVVEGSVTSSFDAPDDNDTDSNARLKNVKQRAEGTGGTFINLNTRFGANIASLDVSNNFISLGGVRLLQLIAEKLPSLVEVKTDGARVDQCELDDLEGILSENRNPE